MAEDAGTRRRAKRRAAEAGGWPVWEKYRWITYHAGIGDGERLLHRER